MLSIILKSHLLLFDIIKYVMGLYIKIKEKNVYDDDPQDGKIFWETGLKPPVDIKPTETECPDKMVNLALEKLNTKINVSNNF